MHIDETKIAELKSVLDHMAKPYSDGGYNLVELPETLDKLIAHSNRIQSILDSLMPYIDIQPVTTENNLYYTVHSEITSDQARELNNYFYEWEASDE